MAGGNTHRRHADLPDGAVSGLERSLAGSSPATGFLGQSVTHDAVPSTDAGAYLLVPNPYLATAAAKPSGFGVYAGGSTIVDGDIVWTCEAPNTSAYGGPGGTGRCSGRAGRHWLGPARHPPAAARGDAAHHARRVRQVPIYRRHQADLSATQAWRQAAVTNAERFFASRGCKLVVGNMIYAPNSSTQGAAYHAECCQCRCAGGITGGISRARADRYMAPGWTGNAALLQADGIHLNGAGALLQGAAYAAAMKAALRG